jgi:hypothetical protein
MSRKTKRIKDKTKRIRKKDKTKNKRKYKRKHYKRKQKSKHLKAGMNCCGSKPRKSSSSRVSAPRVPEPQVSALQVYRNPYDIINDLNIKLAKEVRDNSDFKEDLEGWNKYSDSEIKEGIKGIYIGEDYTPRQAYDYILKYINNKGKYIRDYPIPILEPEPEPELEPEPEDVILEEIPKLPKELEDLINKKLKEAIRKRINAENEVIENFYLTPLNLYIPLLHPRHQRTIKSFLSNNQERDALIDKLHEFREGGGALTAKRLTLIINDLKQYFNYW